MPLWFLLPVVPLGVWAAKKIYDAVTDDDAPSDNGTTAEDQQRQAAQEAAQKEARLARERIVANIESDLASIVSQNTALIKLAAAGTDDSPLGTYSDAAGPKQKLHHFRLALARAAETTDHLEQLALFLPLNPPRFVRNFNTRWKELVSMQARIDELNDLDALLKSTERLISAPGAHAT